MNRFSAVKIPPFGPRLYLTSDTPCPKPADILLHDLFVVDRIAYVNIGGIWHMCDGGVEVEDIRRCVF